MEFFSSKYSTFSWKIVTASLQKVTNIANQQANQHMLLAAGTCALVALIIICIIPKKRHNLRHWTNVFIISYVFSIP